MADDDTPQEGGGGGSGPAKDTPAAKKQVKNEHVLIAVGIVTLIITIIYMRKQASAANAAQVGSTVAASPYGVNQNPYSGGGGGYNDMAQMAQDIQTMQQEITGLVSPNPGGPGANNVSGMWAGSQQTGTPVTAGQQVPASTILFEDIGGVFTPVTDAEAAALRAGTPLYAVQNPSSPTGFFAGNTNQGQRPVPIEVGH